MRPRCPGLGKGTAAPAADPMITESTIACPHCGFKATEAMLTDACLFFYGCGGCGTRLRPKPGDCCVFCSFGTGPCPPVQQSGDWDGMQNPAVGMR
jgi:hypothetical protein